MAQDLIINEVLTSNSLSLEDEDGDSPDWIELYNRGTSTVALNGFALSDDPEDPQKWIFEGGSITPGEHRIIFASEKDRQGMELNWTPLITAGDVWQYFIGVTEPPSSWTSTSFNAGGWSTGPTGIGYGDGDDATVIGATLSLYMRKTFTISDLDEVAALLFHMDVDDGYIAYLNGTEFARQNLGPPGSFVSHTGTASNYTEPLLPQGIDLEPIFVEPDLLLTGTNVLAIQVHNSGTTSSDMSALPFLSLGGQENQPTTLPDYLIIPGPRQFHTNFKLSADGEPLLLSDGSGNVVDSVAIPPLVRDMSYGRASDGSSEYHYFDPATPGSPNQGGFAQLAQPATFQPPPGFYSNFIQVGVAQPGDGTTFRYTMDGSEPDENSPLLLAPINLSATTVLRVRSSSPDGLHQHVSSATYFINEDHELPVISLIFEPDDLFDYNTGIYVMGPNASPDFPHFGANFWEDWERPIHIEYFENAHDLSYSAPGGVKIFGGWSRGQAQRSLALFARGSYGASAFEFPFFERREFDSYQALVLRNSGNDWPISGYRDVFMTSLVAQRDMESQSFQTVEVYLNGDYWGIYHLREKINEHFVASISDLDLDQFDLLEINGGAVHGSNDQFLELYNYVNTHDLSSDTEFEFVRERVDLINFIEYQVAQIYFDNQDWPGNNIKFWKSHRADGRWRWILYDTDFGFGIWNPSAYMNNTLNFAMDPSGPGWPNPPWSTLFLRKFMNNQAFKREFILRASDMLNRDFLPETVIDSLAQRRDAVALGVIDHFDRWQHNNVNNWTNQYNNMQTFANLRPSYMRGHIRTRFFLPQAQSLTVQVQPADAGLVRIHSVTPEAYPWSGLYFATIPVDVTAIPSGGYQFSHWEGLTSSSPELLLNMDSPRNLTAVFVEIAGEGNGMVINEINYHSADDADCGDWLELINQSSAEVNLDGWMIQDSNEENQFILPRLVIAPGQYMVVVADSLDFRAIHGESTRLFGNLDFNFSNGGEYIQLLDPLGNLIDSLTYSDLPPWPIEPDGTGATLELIHPELDNGLSENWAASDGLGTPGARNSRYADPTSTDPVLHPETFTLGAPFPNPFNAMVTIPFSLPNATPTEIQIYDLRGAQVFSHQIENPGPGNMNYQWDGRTHQGHDCSSGIYIVRITQLDHARNTRIALIR
jgi:hypothetical protein